MNFFYSKRSYFVKQRRKFALFDIQSIFREEKREREREQFLFVILKSILRALKGGTAFARQI